MIRVGISSCFLHPDPERATFSKKTLLYFEQSMAHWVMNHGAFPVLLPTESRCLTTKEILKFTDGLILHGGADVAPSSYSEEPISDKWPGDKIRDQYEIKLYREAKAIGLPVLGICRGLQIINVAEGGSLYQDLNTQNQKTKLHRDKNLYDEHWHQINLESNGFLSQIYPRTQVAKVNSVHHQGIKKLAKELIVEATSLEDGVIEAIRHETMRPSPLDSSPFILGVQWHPEFTAGPADLLSENQLMKSFLKAIENRRANFNKIAHQHARK